MTNLNDDIDKCGTSSEDIHINSRAEHNSGEKHTEKLNRIKIQSIKIENQGRGENCNITILKNTSSIHLKSKNCFRNLDQHPTPKPQTESESEQFKTLFQLVEEKLDLLKKN